LPDHLKKIKQVIGEVLDAELLRTSLTHSSYSKEYPGTENNQRLEFYGDSVLKLVFSKYLFNRFPEANEGLLTKYRARLISDDLLATIAEEKFAISKIIYLAPNINRAKLPRSISGDALEAIIGAVFIDKGLDFAEKFILALWQDYIEQALVDALEIDFKSILQQNLQKIHKEHPNYKTLETIGPAHQRSFVVGVYLGEQLLAKGTGLNKKLAGQAAAKQALDKISKG
jgi:ribonuclease-3